MSIRISNHSFVRSVGYSWYLAGSMFLIAVTLPLFQVQPTEMLIVVWAVAYCACVLYSILGGLYIGWVLKCNTCGAKVGDAIANSIENGFKYRRKVIFEGRCPCCEAKITGLMFERSSKERVG